MRSKYIYLIYSESSCEMGFQLLSAHTVKHEAHTWLERSEWNTRTALLHRMRDGYDVASEHSKWDMKPLIMLDWEDRLFNLDEKSVIDRRGIQANSIIADWPEWAQGLL